MNLFLKGSTVLLALTVVAAPSRAAINGNACEANIATGGIGCGISPVGLQHAGGLDGGIDFTGSQYAGKCAGGPSCTTVLQPAMRFWEQDNFFARNSGSALQDDTPNQNWWLINPNLDYGQPSGPNMWIIIQANWANVGVKGCIGSPRAVAEVSFCDPTGVAKYLVMSVADPAISLYDYNMILGANGPNANIVPLTDVPKVTGLPALGGQNVTDAAQMDVSVTLAAGSNKWWTDIAPGANDPANPLVRGFEIVYQNAAAVPAQTCNTGLGAWLPVHNPATPAANLGPMAPGTFPVSVIKPPAGQKSYFSARIVYTDAASGCGPAQACLDPQTQNTPTSCFNEVAGPVDFLGIAVTFGSFAVKREAGTTVSITWQTTMEANTVGFTVERSSSMAGPWTSVGGFVSAMGPGYPYKMIDSSAITNQTFFYRIHETASAGQASISSPLKVSPLSEQGGSRQRNLHIK